VRYLIPLWPAADVDPARVQLRLEIIQYGGLGLALIAACFIIWKTPSKPRKIRITILTLCILVLGISSAVRGNPEVIRRSGESLIVQSPKYRFSEDWVTDNSANWDRVLSDFKGKANIHALEIGSFEGRSALWFLENVLTDPTASITCIDIWAGSYEKLFDENVNAYGQPNKLVKIKSRSDEALRTLNHESFDFIYIDGSHMAKDVLVDAVLAWDLLKPGGYIIFDDYNWYGPRSWLVPNFTPKIAVDAFVRVFEPYLQVMHQDYQLVVRKTMNPDNVTLDTYKQLRPALIVLQQAFR
jgi:predicted O-methyltransferase YrrM